MSALANMVQASQGRLSQVVGRLEKRGWIRRCTDSRDGRCTLAVLTAAGHLLRSWSCCDRRRYVFEALTELQQRQLTEIGRRIVVAFERDHATNLHPLMTPLRAARHSLPAGAAREVGFVGVDPAVGGERIFVEAQ
ncbi:MarR family winged helix-turn-helix transcriptional regulator [Mycobacterium sp. 1245852.3]|uniref:MarR family winged helix-turn-helix transcriptional regulator n=1 Tax=Mycobacterium sp. 1245852.3 TaxID=1856860 RepID=UPI0018D3EB6F|nr:MarR family transcriptional regulator [Mycobacterium sp. 1245852.3]